MDTPSEHVEPPYPGWSLPRRFAFRLWFVFILLYTFTFWLWIALPIRDQTEKLMDALGVWLARGLGITGEIATESTGSGDRTIDWVLSGTYAALALAAALVWTIAGRRAPHHQRLDAGLRVYLRYTLAANMFLYGFVKAFPSQFPMPSPQRLLQPYGDSSPMALLWTFMGYSAGYTIFTGVIEVLGGALLLFRRTAGLGALIVTGAMVQVAALNFAYDVPVKQYSASLVLMALFVAAPDLRRVADVLVLNRATSPVDLGPQYKNRRQRIAARAVKAAVVLGILGISLKEGLDAYFNWGRGRPEPPLYGAWQTEEQTIGGAVTPLLVTDKRLWRHAAFSGRLATIYAWDGTRNGYRMELDVEGRELKLTDFNTEATSTLAVARPDPLHLTIEGTLNGEVMTIKLKRIDQDMALVKRGFHWVNEFPFNR
jgi:hypothetical protein